MMPLLKSIGLALACALFFFALIGAGQIATGGF